MIEPTKRRRAPQPPAVTVPYKAPSERAAMSLGKSAIVAGVVALLVGLLEIVQAYASGEVVDLERIAISISTLLLMVALTSIKKYADALGQEKTP